eukprot:757819-Hanusia_phi.AAC.2
MAQDAFNLALRRQVDAAASKPPAGTERADAGRPYLGGVQPSALQLELPSLTLLSKSLTAD